MFTGHFTDIPQAIQLALAPVFLLTGIAGLLNIMTGRLARIIDRGRKLVEQPLPEQLMGPEQLQRELQILEYRRTVASHAITACTLSAGSSPARNASPSSLAMAAAARGLSPVSITP